MRIGSCALNTIAFDAEISVCKLKLAYFLCLLCVSKKFITLVTFKKSRDLVKKHTFITGHVCEILQSTKSDASCCALLQILTVVSVLWNMGKGSSTFSRITLTADDYHVLQTSACVGCDVLLRMSTSFLLDIFWPLVHVEVSVSLLSCLIGATFYTARPTSVENSPLFHSSWEGFAFLNNSFLSALILSSFHPPLLLRREHNLSLEGLWCKNHCSFSVCRVTCCCLCHHASVIFIRNISGFTFSSLSASTYFSNPLAVSHVWVMACDKQIHHAVVHFPFTSSQVINSCSGNHTKKLSFASSYPTVILEVSTVFPWLRIHSICGNDVVMFGECGLF